VDGQNRREKETDLVLGFGKTRQALCRDLCAKLPQSKNDV
jgi:hypothetical protein